MMRKYEFDSHIFILSFLLIVVFIIIFPSMQDVEFRGSHDEGYYLKYANFISNNGLAGVKGLFTNYIESEKDWQFPNPLRIGFILLSSIWIKLLGSSFYALSHLSFISYLLFIAISYYFCRRLFDKEKALLLSFLIAFSPINMAMSRRALSESVTTLFIGLSIWLFLDIMHKDKGLIKKIVFLIVFSYSILIKETSILLIIPFLVYMAVYGIQSKGNLKLLVNLFCVLICSVCLTWLIYFLISGSLSNVLDVIRIILASPSTNRLAMRYGSGPWFSYIIDYMLLSPWVAILSIGYAFYLLQNFAKSDLKENYFLIVLAMTLLVFNFFTKNIRYVMILDLPLRLFFILMLYRLIAVKSSKTRYIIISLIVLLVCFMDFATFNNIFILNGVYDPVSYWLLSARKMIP